MYGGYGGGMGSSYGGMGGYGGGMGSSYGGLGGSSGGYGGYGGYRGGYDGNRTRQTTQTSAVLKDKQQKQGNEAGGPIDPQKKRQEQNPDKKVVEEWFKMMGGLRSILELGMAALALTNFCITTKDLVKKFFEFSKQTSLSVVKFIQGKIPSKMIRSLVSPEHRGRTIKFLAVTMLRVFAGVLLVLGLRMRRDLRKDAARKHEEMVGELQKLKENEVEMEDKSEIEARQEEGANHDANL